MTAVKDRMLSRRQFFCVSAPPAMAAGYGAIEDLTCTYDDVFPTYFGELGISMEQKFRFAENGFNLMQLSVNGHTGMYIDAREHKGGTGGPVRIFAMM